MGFVKGLYKGSFKGPLLAPFLRVFFKTCFVEPHSTLKGLSQGFVKGLLRSEIM